MYWIYMIEDQDWTIRIESRRSGHHYNLQIFHGLRKVGYQAMTRSEEQEMRALVETDPVALIASHVIL